MAVVSVLVMGFVVCPCTAQPALEEALSRIRHNVAVFEAQVPDFVCNEKITSRTLDEKDGSVIKETVIESAFSGRQKQSVLSRLSFTEEREIRAINGAPSAAKSMPEGVFRVGGGYSSSLVSVFGSKGEESYSFSLTKDGEGGADSAPVISFETTNRHQKIKGGGHLHSFDETGRAWFDRGSYDIVRLERRILTGSGASDELLITIDYKPVQIGENSFRMPACVSATAHRTASGRAERGDYAAEYTDYRKYGSSSTIEFQEPVK